jgi:nitroreductase
MARIPEGLTRDDLIRCVDWVIRERRTRKITEGPSCGEAGETPSTPQAFASALREAIEVAGWAPFHYPRTPEVPEPWRFYVFDRINLDRLMLRIQDLLIGKLPVIMEGAGAMVQVTWLPEVTEEKSRRNWEHAAAAAAAAQNLLLAAEARGMATYWSSAAPLASEKMFDLCSIPESESYLGTIFLGRPLSPDREASEGFDGKMRERRTPPDGTWARWVQL